MLQAKALAQGISEIELKVLEATNSDKWGPHGNDMKGVHQGSLTWKAHHTKVPRAGMWAPCFSTSSITPNCPQHVSFPVLYSCYTEIAQACNDPEKFYLVMNALWGRLQERDENWRCVTALSAEVDICIHLEMMLRQERQNRGSVPACVSLQCMREHFVFEQQEYMRKPPVFKQQHGASSLSTPAALGSNSGCWQLWGRRARCAAAG
jgi:hypothetical protein